MSWDCQSVSPVVSGVVWSWSCWRLRICAKNWIGWSSTLVLPLPLNSFLCSSAMEAHGPSWGTLSSKGRDSYLDFGGSWHLFPVSALWRENSIHPRQEWFLKSAHLCNVCLKTKDYSDHSTPIIGLLKKMILVGLAMNYTVRLPLCCSLNAWTARAVPLTATF